MPQRVTRPVLVPLSCVLLVLGGCLCTPPSRFYLLPTLTDVSSPAAMGERALTIGVGPVTLPPYLDRPQIVTRASRAQLHLAELDQWAASLQDTVARVLAENLSLLMPTACSQRWVLQSRGRKLASVWTTRAVHAAHR